MPCSVWCAPHLFHPATSVRGRLPQFALLALCLTFSTLASQAQAANYEERKPESAAFDGLANQIVYVDQVTPPGEVLPKTSELWTVFSDGLGKMRLTSGHKDSNPRFNPDGKQILFERDSDGDIWVINVLGDGLRNLTNTPEVSEYGAQFSNSGDSVFLLTPAPIQSKLEAQELAKQPFLAMFRPNVLVELNLKDGSRRQLLDDTYNVQAVMPDPFNDSEIIVLCNRLRDDGHPDPFSDKALVAAPLKAGAPRPFYTPPKNYDIKKAAVAGEYLVLSTTTPEKYSPQTFLLKKSKIQTKPIPTDHTPLERLPFVGDISCEGTKVVGTSMGMYETREKRNGGLFFHRLEIYDIATKKWHTVIQE